MSASSARPTHRTRSPVGKRPVLPPRGLYSQFFSQAERELLQIFPASDARSELNLLRVVLARTLAASRLGVARDLRFQAALLSILGRTAGNIASLSRLRAQILSPSDDPLLEALAALDPDDL